MPAAKYIMGNMPPVRGVPSLPNAMPYPTNPAITSLLNSYLPSYSNVMPNLPLTNIPKPPAMLPTQQLNSLAFPTSPNMKLAGPPMNAFDSAAMNNLAIALHLLILTNLLHSESEPKPPAYAEPNPQTPVVYPQNQPQSPAYPQPIVHYLEPQPQEPANQSAPPNSKFLSSSGFVEPPMSSLMSPPIPGHGTQNSSPRNNNYLMSPYEALGPGPQGKDVFAQYGPQNLKADFQSPYNSIMAHDNSSKDLFNMF